MIFDTHAHYDDEAFDEDRDELLSKLPESGIAGVVNVGASLRGIEDSQKLAEKYHYIYAAVGVHPDEVGSLDEEKMKWMYELCRKPKTAAVGEIGLDYHWNKETHECQKEWFIRQLQMAKEVKLPVNIHSREAAQDTYDIIKQYHAGTTGGIIHCFSSSALMALAYVRLGYYIGIGGVVTFKNARVIREVVEAARKVTGDPIKAVISPRRAGDPARLIASSEKAKRVLGWKPEHADLEEIIATAWNWHRNHPHGYVE